MNVPAVLVANGSALVLLAIVLASSRRMVHYGMEDHRLFAAMLCLCASQCVLETVCFLVDGREGVHGLLLVLNSLLYISNILFAFLWTVYADFKLFSDRRRLRRQCCWLGIPAALVCVGSVVNLFTPVFFAITAENVYVRTPLYFVPFVLTYLYLAYGVFLIYFYRDKVHKYLFLPAIVFMVPILIGSVLQAVFYGYSLTWIGAAIGLTSLYINVQNEVSYVDSMTGLFTRQYLVRYLSLQFKNLGPGGQLTGVMLDIDRFKEINDTYGHLMGDQAIAEAGKLLRRSLPPRGMAARYAGDEFVIIALDADTQAVTQAIRKIADNAEKLNRSGQRPYTLRFSTGCSEYCKGDTIDTFLGRMDAAMYADKRRKNGLKRRITDVREPDEKEGGCNE
ncbi:MAG: GGDEF domain-containing protein [Eubacteriales bacterium]|nr:GGDEF domain-containing protein [Eubacteriales bacterium]